MNHNIKGTSLDITSELRAYVEKKLGHTDKFLAGDSTAHADIELQYSAVRDGGKYRAEFTISAAGELYRAEEWGSTMHEAIDLTIEEIVKELRTTKKKRLHSVRKGALRIKDFIRGFRRKV